MAGQMSPILSDVVSLLPGCVDPLDSETARLLDLYCWRVLELRGSRLIRHGEARMSVSWGEDGMSLVGLPPRGVGRGFRVTMSPLPQADPRQRGGDVPPDPQRR